MLPFIAAELQLARGSSGALYLHVPLTFAVMTGIYALKASLLGSRGVVQYAEDLRRDDVTADLFMNFSGDNFVYERWL